METLLITSPRIEAMRDAAYLLSDLKKHTHEPYGGSVLESASEYLWDQVAQVQLWEAGFRPVPKVHLCGPGQLWRASVPGVMEPEQANQHVQLCGDECGIVEVVSVGDRYKGGFQLTWHWVLSLRSVPEVIDWLSVNGKPSEPGLPPFSTSWD